MAQKPIDGNDAIFWNSIFGIFNCCTTKQMTFLESWEKTEQNRHAFKKRFGLSKSDLFWPELDLTLCQMWKWMSPSSYTCQMTHKTCITRNSCDIFIWWPHFTWPWPWPVLSISLLFTWNLRHPFSGIFAEFALAAVSGLNSAAEKRQLWPLIWPWPNIWPCKENFKIASEFPRWELSITASRFSLRLLVRNLGREGGDTRPPQPTKVDWRLQFRAG